MPRQYKRKSLRATSYSQEDLRLAVAQVKSGELSNYAASKLYGIPTSTLNDHVKGKTGLLSQSLGRPPAIPIEMENKLAHCLRTLEKWGWGLSRTEILDIVSEFIRANKIITPFKNNRPGPDWFILFRLRHNLSIKKPQSVEYLRKRMTDPFVIAEYFTLLKKTLLELGIHNPEQIWNLDETSVCLDPTKTKVVGGKGLPCTRTTQGSGKENVTVLTTVNAAGSKLSPLIVFKGKYMYNEWMSANQKDKYDFEISYAASKRGWMETDIFYNYMKRIVIPGLGENRPVLMIYDGHSTHVDTRVVALASENNITILKLPAHTSHLLQPLDLAVFKSFKTSWDKKLVQWQRQNVGVKLRKQTFSELFAETWHQVSPFVIQSGFRKGGIYPLNADVIPEEKYDPAALRRWKYKVSQNKSNELKTLKQMCLEVVNKNMSCNITSTTQFGISNPQFPPQYETSFEELLLQKVSQHSKSGTGSNKTVKLSRAAKGSEVITRTYLEKMKEKEVQNTQNTNMNSIETFASLPNDNEKPGPSGISNKKLKKKKETHKTRTQDKKVTIDKTNDQKNTIITKKGKGVGKKSKTVIESHTRTDTLESREKDTNENTICQNISNSTNLNIQNAENCFQKTGRNKTKHVPKKQRLKTTCFKKTMKKIKRPPSVTTTSESGEISIHSDSDIIDVLSDIFSESDFVPYKEEQELSRTLEMNQIILQRDQDMEELQINEIVEVLQKGERMEELQIEEKVDILQMDGKVKQLLMDGKVHDKRVDEKIADKREKVTMLSSVRYRPENKPFIGKLQLKKIDLNFDVTNKRRKDTNDERNKENRPAKIPRRLNFNDERNEEKKNTHKNEELSETKIRKDNIYQKGNEKNSLGNTKIYNTGDTVLVRYYTKFWKYYVGVIEHIHNETEKKKYSICYYKTIGKKYHVKFVVSKRKDQDCVPEDSIVKQIQLLQIKENPGEFTLLNVEDAIYF
ncbi:uncharacterized protein LOC123876488 [Maniola jurtina]|uniref:uncharacterized protein LOC123876488 n=1 Tax=Maniola jurtina TaxID=191418 RepID=UPI001E687F57|nr:uncharacterized protein LOC123876488 [Maniola jurtina]